MPRGGCNSYCWFIWCFSFVVAGIEIPTADIVENVYCRLPYYLGAEEIKMYLPHMLVVCSDVPIGRAQV